MKLIILDRDGVINEDSDSFIKSAEEWIPIPGSLEAIARFNHSGYRVVVASNQSGIGRGLFTVDDLNKIHSKMRRELARVGAQIEGVFFCPHNPEEGCRCRKPLPGLFEQIARRLHVDLRLIPSVGDSIRDVKAAQAVGATPFLVLTGKGGRTVTENSDELEGVSIYSDLATVADTLIIG